MIFFEVFRKSLKNLVDLIFPWGKCRICRLEIEYGVVPGICFSCFKKRKKTKGNLCQICSREMPCAEQGSICGICEEDRPAYDKHFNRYQYEGAIREMVLNFKAVRRYPIARLIGRSIAREVKKNGREVKFDYVTFIPSSLKRRLWLGFSPAELIARTVSKELHVPIADILRLQKRPRTQKGLTASERKENFRGAFACRRSFQDDETVLLVDDIFTTGSTIGEASLVLKQSGARVFTATFAMTGRRAPDLAGDTGRLDPGTPRVK